MFQNNALNRSSKGHVLGTVRNEKETVRKKVKYSVL